MIKRLKKYCIIIPAFNSQKTLPVLLDRIQKLPYSLKIIVVNDGSNDNTSEILTSYNKVDVITHEKNIGKGAALKSGISRAKGLGFLYAITLDADLQHSPERISDFIKAHKETDKTLILGVRQFSNKKMPFHRILSNTITSLIVSIRVGIRIHDSQCGYRLIDISKIRMDNFKEAGFQFESEFLLKIVPTGATFKEIPIPTIYNESRSSIKNLKDTFKFIILVLRSYFWS